MHLHKNVDFEEVTAIFLRENPVGTGSNEWAFSAIQAANRQFASWAQTTLTLEDILAIMLPHHLHDGLEIVPPRCATVAQAIENLKLFPASCACSSRIDALSTKPGSIIFLSTAPVNHPDYQGLLYRNHKGLTHLDGLHRLIAWGRLGKSGIVAYIAGLATPQID